MVIFRSSKFGSTIKGYLRHSFRVIFQTQIYEPIILKISCKGGQSSLGLRSPIQISYLLLKIENETIAYCNATKPSLKVYNIKLSSQQQLMRRRSGALHCQSAEDYQKLAQASYTCTAIFYDEKVNRKIMGHLKTPDKLNKIPQQLQNPELSPPKDDGGFNGFEFEVEDIATREEREELARRISSHHRQVNVAITTFHFEEVIQRLGGVSSSDRSIDMVVANGKDRSFKFWVFKKESTTKESALLDLYLQRCEILLQEPTSGLEWIIIKNKKQNPKTAQQILSLLPALPFKL